MLRIKYVEDMTMEIEMGIPIWKTKIDVISGDVGNEINKKIESLVDSMPMQT